MIDLALSKEKAVGAHLWGLFYDGWAPNPEEEGVSVFIRGYEQRGPHNERKKIYVSAITPDLYRRPGTGPSSRASSTRSSPTPTPASR